MSDMSCTFRIIVKLIVYDSIALAALAHSATRLLIYVPRFADPVKCQRASSRRNNARPAL
jgi:hypothetical protein